MTDKSASDGNIEVAQRIQEKFDAYLLGLIFTVLAVSIQTAEFGTSLVADAFELFSWVCLLVAGLAGLSRLEWIPEQYRLYSLQLEKEALAREGEKARLAGAREFHVLEDRKVVNAEEHVTDARASAQKVAGALEPIAKKNTRKYRIMRTAFVVGLVSVMIARALVPAAAIIARWPWRLA